MSMHQKVLAFATAGALSLAGFGAVGCGPAAPTAKLAQITPGDMPDKGDWAGVYYSELYGYLHIVKQGGSVSGKWMRPPKDKWGELTGTVTGNTLRFKWIEHTIGAVGPNSTREGHGYFVYKRPAGDNVDDQIVGEIGRHDDEVGDPWDAIKQRNMTPDLSSIGGSGSRDLGGGDWDGDSKEGGKAEPPKAP